MGFRQLKSDPFQAVMNTGTMSVSMNGRVSHIISPMRNTDIKRCVKLNNWSELIEKAKIQTNRFRRDFYSKGV